LIWAITLLGFGLLAWLTHWAFWIPAGLLLLMNLLYWIRIKEHFQRGCANPGLVVSLDPMLIAVSTDLSMGTGKYPVVKIVRENLKRIAGQPPEVGMRLGTVALYEASLSEEKPHWKTFDPRPVDHVTANLSEIERIMNSFSQLDWKDLDRGLLEVPQPY